MTAEWYSEDELRALLRGPEGELVERKESPKGDAPRAAVCAFANDLPDNGKPGVLFIGAKDNGEPVGLTVDEDLVNALASIRANGDILPPPSLRVTPLAVGGDNVACVQVMPSNAPPVKFRGRIYVRVAASTHVANSGDEAVLNAKRLLTDAPFDARPISAASMEDLDLLYFEREYIPKMFPPEILSENDRSLEQRLAVAKMISGHDDPVPTVLGILVLGKDVARYLPGAYVQFLRIDGDELDSDPVDEEAMFGAIPEIARRLREKLRAHNRVRVEYVNVPLEKRHWAYPETALLQIAYNAILHRRYDDTHAPVRVYWFNDRIEIDNPGGLFGEVARRGDEFPDLGISDCRNPNLVEAMKHLDLAQRLGSGLGLAKRALEKNGNPPMEWDRKSLGVHAHCTLRVAS